MLSTIDKLKSLAEYPESIKLLELQDYVINSLKKRPLIKKYIPKKIHQSIKIYIDETNPTNL